LDGLILIVNTVVTIIAMDAKTMLLSTVPLSPIHAWLPAPTVKPIAELTASLPAATVANYNGEYILLFY
jgi:hypothetical protein